MTTYLHNLTNTTVPELEILVAEGPRRMQLRYFHAMDRNEAEMLARGLGSEAGPELLDLSREYGVSVPARRYELWLPPTRAGEP